MNQSICAMNNPYEWICGPPLGSNNSSHEPANDTVNHRRDNIFLQGTTPVSTLDNPELTLVRGRHIQGSIKIPEFL